MFAGHSQVALSQSRVLHDAILRARLKVVIAVNWHHNRGCCPELLKRVMTSLDPHEYPTVPRPGRGTFAFRRSASQLNLLQFQIVGLLADRRRSSFFGYFQPQVCRFADIGQCLIQRLALRVTTR